MTVFFLAKTTMTTSLHLFLSFPDNRNSNQRQQLWRSSGLVPERHDEFWQVKILLRRHTSKLDRISIEKNTFFHCKMAKLFRYNLLKMIELITGALWMSFYQHTRRRNSFNNNNDNRRRRSNSHNSNSFIPMFRQLEDTFDILFVELLSFVVN